MKFILTKLKGLYAVELDYLTDKRGYFSRLVCQEEFKKIGLKKEIVQVNLSHTEKKGTVRGMHFQIVPKEETKIIYCLRGKAFDVAVDIRPDSSTYLDSFAVELSPRNKNMAYIPEGFAHGFQALEDETELIYFHTEYHNPEFERGLNCTDPKLKINWPLSILEISEKDKSYPLI